MVWIAHINLIFLLAGLAQAAANDNKQCHINLGACDEWSPCCNTAGWCGKGFQHCGSTCVEKGNFKGVKCMPDPGCVSKTYKLSKARIAQAGNYTGDHDSTDFTIEGNYAIQNDAVVLKLARSNTGSTLYSTRFMKYGRVSAMIKTSRTGGVVSSFILMAKDKDEIDFEWVGNKLQETQTNWYSKGVFPTWPATNGANYPTQNTHSKFIRYTIDWSPNQIQWIADGKVLRTLPKTSQHFPQSPARFSFGIWDAGSGAEGTRQWAGGYVDWNSEDMRNQGFFDVRIKDIKVECYRN